MTEFSIFSQFLYNSHLYIEGMTYTESGWIFCVDFQPVSVQIILLVWLCMNYTESDWKSGNTVATISVSFCISHAFYIKEWIIQKLTEIWQCYQIIAVYLGVIYTETDWNLVQISASFCKNHCSILWTWILQKLTEI